MKNRYLIKLGTMILLAVFISSCEKWIDPKINVDPDAALDVQLQLLLPAIQVDLAYVIGGMDIRGVAGMWVQHVSGQARQAATMGKNYNLTEADVNNAWNSFYNGSLMDIKIYLDKAGAENPQARGLGKIHLAMALGQITDLWGDIPYSEAFLGNSNLKPIYDSQQSIYAEINKLLTDAITDLSTDNSVNLFPLGSASNDLIYNGNIPKWIAAARSLRARYALHMSKKASVDYNAILADLAAGISSNANDLQLVFGNTESNANPLYQFDVQRTDVAPSTSFAARAVGDPRMEVFKKLNGRNFGTFYGSINSPVPFVTFVEKKFIEAEAHLRKTIPSQSFANTSYDAAVINSLAKFGIPLSPDTGSVNSTKRWIRNNTTYSTTTDLGPGRLTDRTIRNIIEAKYIALFMQTEAFNDYRRTGWPVLVPTAGTTVPVRFPYPTDERLYNSGNVPAGITLSSPLWWMSAK